MPWNWKINLHCYFCEDSDKEFDIKKPLTPCDTILTDIDGKLTAVTICKPCYDKEEVDKYMENYDKEVELTFGKDKLNEVNNNGT